MFNSMFTKGNIPKRLVRSFRKPLLDNENSYLGSLDKESICDLNGIEIANFSRIEKTKNVNGIEVNVRVYQSSEFGDIKVLNNELFLDNSLIGYVGKRGARLIVLIIIMSILLALFLAMIYLMFDIPAKRKIEIVLGNENNPQFTDGKIDIFDSKLGPGTSGQYQFSIENKEKKPVTYKFKLEEEYDKDKIDYFPILYRLSGSNQNSNEANDWVEGSELFLENYVIGSKKTDDFTLEWEWPYEGNDHQDTLIGENSIDYSIVLKITATYFKGE